MSLCCSKKEEKLFFKDVYISVMIENKIYCYINGFLMWNISKKTSKDFFVKNYNQVVTHI